MLQHFAHLAMDEVDCLKWSDHDAELDDLAGVVAADDVDAIDVLPLNCGFKLEDCGVSGQHLLGVTETLG